MSERVTTPYEGHEHAGWDPGAEIEAPLRLHRTTARPEWMDYNDHMSESCYLLVFGDSADAFFRFLGIDEAYRAAGHSLYTSETHLHHRREVALGEPLELTPAGARPRPAAAARLPRDAARRERRPAGLGRAAAGPRGHA